MDRDRSAQQDPLFGIRQIVAVAVKALSPGINDPTTAEQALDHLGGVINELLTRVLRSRVQTVVGSTWISRRAPTFSDYVEASFGQIRRAACSNLHVALHLLDVLRSLVSRASDEHHVVALRNQLDDVVDGL